MTKKIAGFSKLTKDEKIDWLANHYFQNNDEVIAIIKQYWNSNSQLQKLHDDFIENTITNFYLPFGVAPNFIINGKSYVLPMVIEESSVVAAAALTAKFWATKGGFTTTVLGTEKIGHVHFMYAKDVEHLQRYFEKNKTELRAATASITKNMEKRGGGILDIQLKDCTSKLPNYYQLEVTFETKDSMGANFINSCLEAIAQKFKNEDIEIVMSILSNYVPNCLVRAEVSCKIEELGIEQPQKFAEKFYQAVQIAKVEPYRAVTHNKGIMNGIDALVLATGNDFRAVEAGVHAYASKNGTYTSLSDCSIDDGVFKFWLEIPLALGTVGGLTALHPLAKLSLEMLQNPSARELMQIIAAAGLAQNFAALRALTTKGIQHGHMKMHLMNILNQVKATTEEIEKTKAYFKDKTVSHSDVLSFIEQLRKTPKVNWVDFQNKKHLQKLLSNLKKETTPVFGKMNSQQMIEHLSFIMKVSTNQFQPNIFVADEKAARRKPFLDSEMELQPGFQASFLSDKAQDEKFVSLELAIEDLFDQIDAFEKYFKVNEGKLITHPFFGDLDYEYWVKFHKKHFTHHFKQFNLV